MNISHIIGKKKRMIQLYVKELKHRQLGAARIKSNSLTTHITDGPLSVSYTVITA